MFENFKERYLSAIDEIRRLHESNKSYSNRIADLQLHIAKQDKEVSDLNASFQTVSAAYKAQRSQYSEDVTRLNDEIRRMQSNLSCLDAESQDKDGSLKQANEAIERLERMLKAAHTQSDHREKIQARFAKMRAEQNAYRIATLAATYLGVNGGRTKEVSSVLLRNAVGLAERTLIEATIVLGGK